MLIPSFVRYTMVFIRSEPSGFFSRMRQHSGVIHAALPQAPLCMDSGFRGVLLVMVLARRRDLVYTGRRACECRRQGLDPDEGLQGW